MAFRRSSPRSVTRSPVIEDAVALGRAAAHAAAQLVQLREAEALGVLDHHDGGVGDVDTDLDNRGGDQHIDFAALEAAHDDLFFVGVEAAMEQSDAQSGERTLAELFMHFDGGLEP